LQLLAKKGTASNDVKTPPECNKKARLGEGKKHEDKNDEVAKKTALAQISRRLISLTTTPKKKMIGNLLLLPRKWTIPPRS
jgi:hypothetical protein